MFHPVGSQPPSVYWRRRLMVIGSVALLIVLLVVTVKIAASGGNGKPVGAATTTSASTPSVTQPSTPHPSSHPVSSPRSTAPGTARSSAPTSNSAPTCTAAQLSVQAVVGSATYHVGDKPLLELQVTNTGSQPCVQDLADAQIEMRVYNGESRVWGSHDCQVQSGTNPRTLAARQPVRVAITWSGLTSQPKCAGTRQRVGAGTYTLYALLAGHNGHATQFTIN